MKTHQKLAFGLLTMAVTASACGGGAAVAKGAPASGVSLAKVQQAQYCSGAVPPKGDSIDDPNGGPTASACWANGLYVGDGPLVYKQIIFADKEVNLAASITPQAIRKNPTQAEHDFVGSLSQFASPGLINVLWSSLQAGATAGDVTVASGKNPSDPTGIANADFHVTPIGVKTVPGFPDPVPVEAFTKATVTECTDNQTYVENAQGQRLSGTQGHPGYLSSTDTMQKTASGWIMTATTAAKEVPSCS